MSKPALDIITSPQAEKMRDMVTYGFYDQSRVALWMMEVIGREFDEVGEWIRELRNEIFPQTCTWSIDIWEFVYGFEPDDSLSLEYRRARILAHRWSHPPINPARIEEALSAISGTPVHITEHVAPYTFRVDFDESIFWDGTNPGGSFEHREALRLLRTIKPSHLSFRMTSTIVVDYKVSDYYAGAMIEVIVDYYLESHPIKTDSNEYHAAVSNDNVNESHAEDNTPIITTITDLHFAADHILIRENIVAPGSLVSTNETTYHAGMSEFAVEESHIQDIVPIITDSVDNQSGAAHNQIKEAIEEWKM